MNSLQIYEIPELNDIITDYQTQFEKIDKLEKELYFGNTEIKIKMGMDEVKLEIKNFEFTVYLNNEKVFNF